MARKTTSRPASIGSKKAAASPKASRSPKGASVAKAVESTDLAGESFARARDFVEANANLQTAGIALAGAGILALVSTQAGRSLIKTATDAVVKIASQNFGSLIGSDDQAADESRQKPSRQRADQARI